MLSTSFDAGVDLRDVQIAARHADPRTTMRSGPQEPRPPPELHPDRLHGLRHLTAAAFPALAGETSGLAESGALLCKLAIHGRVCSCTTPLISAQSANARNYAPSTQAYQAAGHRAAWRV
jgi:hypothetical protein